MIRSAASYSIRDGLSQTMINCLFEDSQGYLWIGTRDGLNRYNGYDFVVFRVNPSSDKSISDNYIRDIAETSGGEIWIATNYHISVFDKQTHTFQTIQVTRNKNDPSTVYGLLYDENNQCIWAKTEKSLVRIDPTSHEVLFFDHYNNPFSYVQNELAYPILTDSKGMLWLGSGDGLFYFDRELDLFQRFSYDEKLPNTIGDDMVTVIVESQDPDENGLFIGTRQGLYWYSRDRRDFQTISYAAEVDMKSGYQYITDIVFVDQDEALVATRMGLLRLENRKLHLAGQFLHNNQYLDQIGIYKMIKDQGNLLWMASEIGLLKFDLKPSKFNLVRSEDGGGDGIPDAAISAVHALSVQDVWMGTRNNGLFHYNVHEKEILAHYMPGQTDKQQHIENYIYSVYKDSKGNVWTGTAKGLFVQGKDLSTQPELICDVFANLSCEVFLNNPVYAIVEDQKGGVWFACSQGIHKFDYQEERLSSVYHIYDQDQAMPLKNVMDIEPGRRDELWIATESGLLWYDFFSGEAQGFQMDTLAEIASRKILNLCYDDSLLWVGTFHGLLKFSIPESRFRELRNSSFPNVNVRSVEKDGTGNIWMGTTRGIVRYNPSASSFQMYDMADGTQGFEFFRGSSSVGADGVLMFGGVEGLNWFVPDKMEMNRREPSTVISFIEVISENQLLQERPVHNAIEIPASAHVFSVYFSALDFTDPKKNKYAYRFYREGSRESSWIQLENHHMATFTNIAGGSYIFEVKGANNDGVWSDDLARLQVYVKAPFYKQRWAYWIYLVGFLLGFVWIIRYRTQHLIRSNKILREKEVAANVIELQNKELELKNKDITDSINYARRIQDAMMPSRDLFSKLFTDSFVLYKPKSIVSGDFFWINQHDQKIFVAAVDCTGHGVPGAFMSLIGIDLFRKITVLKGVEKPSQILELLNENFRKMFDGDHTVHLRDGMDLSFCVIDKQNQTVEYAGAFNPLYVVRNNSIIEFPAERCSIGLNDDQDKGIRFTNHLLDLQADDVLYLFSDGYADQFGGPYGKKYKKRRFRHLLLTIHKHSLSRQVEILDQSIESWKGENEQVDDILVIGIRP